MLKIHDTICDGCGTCVAICPTMALSMPGAVVAVQNDRCSSCGNCVAICPVAALVLKRDASGN